MQSAVRVITPTQVESDKKKKTFACADKAGADDYSRFTGALIQQQQHSESTAASASVFNAVDVLTQLSAR